MTILQSKLITLILLISVIFFASAGLIAIRILLAKARDTEKYAYCDYNIEVSSINGVLDIIDEMISLHVAHKLKEALTTKKNYDILNIDKDCAEIADTVYQSFDQQFFVRTQHWHAIVTSRFWMNYIIKKTTITMLTSIKEVQALKEGGK